jgi:MoaA/NifB/PqqE/SkfB family radical SAM enzyme
MLLINHPVLCNYYLTYRCNATCDFCDIWEKPSQYVELEQFKNNLIELKKLKVKVIDFTGGEPLLHRGLGEMLSLAKEAGFLTTVTTNCLLYPKRAEELRGKIDMLHFSMDFSTAEKHNKSRGVDCFNHIIKSIELAKGLGERPDVLLTVHEENIEEIEAIYKRFCLPNKFVLILNPIFSYNKIDEHGGLNATHFKTLRYWAKKEYIFLNEAFLKLREDGGNQIHKPICKASSSTIVITPDNKLSLPCYHLSEKELSLKDGLATVYHSTEATDTRKKEGRLKSCQGCEVNCYMQPSFAVNVNKYWWVSLKSTLKYNWLKGTWKVLLGL